MTDLVHLTVKSKIDKVHENVIMWSEKTPTSSSVITHRFLTVDGMTFCNEHVEKQGFDVAGTWREVWGKDFEDNARIVTTFSVKEGEHFES